MFELHVRIGSLAFDIGLTRTTENKPDDEPPYIDTKYAAHLGNPTGFGLLIRPDHTDGE